MESWFVYYKLPADQTAAVLAAVRTLQDALCRRCGVPGRLLCRPDAGGGVTTLMEIYEPVPDTVRFARELDAAVAASALTLELRDARRIERFVDT